MLSDNNTASTLKNIVKSLLLTTFNDIRVDSVKTIPPTDLDGGKKDTTTALIMKQASV